MSSVCEWRPYNWSNISWDAAEWNSRFILAHSDLSSNILELIQILQAGVSLTTTEPSVRHDNPAIVDLYIETSQ